MREKKNLLYYLTTRKVALAALGVMILVLLVDFYVGKSQEAFIRGREEEKRRIERLAFYMISVDVRDVKETKDILKTEEYEAAVRVDNVADESVYITPPHVKAYIQTGEISWMEVQVSDPGEDEAELMPKIEVDKVEAGGRLSYRKMLLISRDIPYNPNLMPRYMHVRFYISMFVLPESEFKEGEVVDRRNSTFVYLKPYYVTDREIREVIDFGETEVPVYIPITAFRKWDEEGLPGGGPASLGGGTHGGMTPSNESK